MRPISTNSFSSQNCSEISRIWRIWIQYPVFDVGCPSIDAILSVEKDSEILKKFNLKTPYFLLIQHPVTTEISQSEFQIKETLSAIVEANINTLIILPNNDAGYSKIMDQIKSSKISSVDTLSIKDYVNLLRHSSGLIGNSSSGIMEAPFLHIPSINIGTRQEGRSNTTSIINVKYNKNIH